MFGIGLTGGIGSGKTSVSDRLVERGAVLVDADLITHEIQRPGGIAYGPIMERFGGSIRAADGTIDRPALAKIVFNDEAARNDLNGIVWPLVGVRMGERRDELAETDVVVVFSIPILRPSHRDALGLKAIVVVDCDVDVAVERLVSSRGMDREDALARIAAQVSREERTGWADFVLDNSASVEHLDAEVARLWAWIAEQQATGS